jgi:hypothetical protein
MAEVESMRGSRLDLVRSAQLSEGRRLCCYRPILPCSAWNFESQEGETPLDCCLQLRQDGATESNLLHSFP